MSGLQLTITDAGRAALVNAANTGTAPVTVAQVGVTATAFAPAANMTALPGEFARLGAIAGEVAADDTIHLVVSDEGPGQYTVRGFGLYLQDGTLFALYGQGAAILEKSASAMLMLTVDVRFVDVAATSLTFGSAGWTNPPATETRQGVVELATAAEVAAGVDTLRAVTPAGLKPRLDAKLNRAGDTMTGPLVLTPGVGGAHADWLVLKPSDFGRLNPQLAIFKDGLSYKYTVAFFDGTDNHGWLDFSVTSLSQNGQQVWHAGNFQPSEKAAAIHSHDWAQVTGKPSAFPPAAHGHSIADVTGLPNALDGKLPVTGGYIYGSLFITHGTATTPGEVFVLRPSDFGAGKPQVTFYKTSIADQWILSLWDGGANMGELDILCARLKHNGQLVWHAGNFDPASRAPAVHGHDWAQITGKPSTYAPAAHGHGIGDVNGLQGALDGKSASGHGHPIGDVTGLQGALDGKAASGHGHAIGDVTGLQGALDGKAAAGHGHAIAGVTGLQGALDGKAAAGHGHGIGDVIGLQGALDGKAASGHGHAIDNVIGLQTALSGKAAASHAHAIDNVTGLQAALDGKLSTAGGALTGPLVISPGSSTANSAFLAIRPTDWGPGKPQITFAKTAVADRWLLSLWDGAVDAGELDILCARLKQNGQQLWHAGNFDPASRAPAIHGHDWAQITGKPSTYAPAAHGHGIADVTGLQGALDGKLSTAGGSVTGALAISPGSSTAESAFLVIRPTDWGPGKPLVAFHKTAVADRWLLSLWDGAVDAGELDILCTRLKQNGQQLWHAGNFDPASRAPAIHSHDWAQITGKPSTYAPAAHGHAIADVTGLQGALDGKAASGHGHAIADVTGLQGALDGKSASGHGHAIADVTGLQGALDGKAANGHGHAAGEISGLAPQGVRGADGWRWDPRDGHLEQWGRLTGALSAEGQVTVQFPVVFQAAEGIVATIVNPGGSVTGSTLLQEVSLDAASAVMIAQSHQSSFSDAGGGFRWRAWGYSAAAPAANTAWVADGGGTGDGGDGSGAGQTN